ncbi:glycosyltransferase family 4 protein [Pseudomonas syringae]|uniref:glycosyltransferase family 4 protein n=1 Tax=Pseudomonas syringae TaxID=317 RepID=UPI001BCCDFA0|nr:glycosyltransferase family 1 protein [Pseudomonas syringae]MBS7436559.1 glycosyltransferase family 4 protein [Pseudomonas syringae]MBS7459944.1 glycosyltransferase family 4 protein [Pseudomonas syringae]QVI71357.1 glycosyltransferase family 4 protein [Pseudomonas syringae]
MRIVIDLQGAQSESRFRGIGRYSLSLAQAIARNAGSHEIWLALNNCMSESIPDIRAAFAGLIPESRIRIFDVPGDANPTPWVARASEVIRESFLSTLKPDAVVVSSLFEGYWANAVTSVGAVPATHQTAVILYDLIPFMNEDVYLPTAELKDYYHRKIDWLKKADTLLAISDSSRQEAVTHLGIDQAKIANISAAIGEQFIPDEVNLSKSSAILERLGVKSEFILYAPGGFDPRKNFARLLEAYSTLPSALKARHQLVIASKLHAQQRMELLAFAEQYGVKASELVLTGYVNDADLIALYSLTKLFVFPSTHEGFGLPVLEAMACGAAVIGSNCSSVPEVIGFDEALFDPFSVGSIAAKMLEGLESDGFRSRLLTNAGEQCKKFSWDESAKKAIEALESRHSSVAADQPDLPDPGAALLERLISLSDTAPTDIELFQVAKSIAFDFAGADHRQLLLDVSSIVHSDAKSGIQRVVRSLLHEFLNDQPAGLTVRPIYFADGQYYYANAFASRIYDQFSETTDAIIDFAQDDIYLSLDLNMHLASQLYPLHSQMRQMGVQVSYIVYDLLLFHRPDWWVAPNAELFNDWLQKISMVASSLICISGAVADELKQWLADNVDKCAGNKPNVKSFHLGADIDNSLPSAGLPDDAGELLARLAQKPSFLMVSTVEPRKGHAQTLSAFESLWEQGQDINLVIVGKRGWLVDELVARLENHPEKGNRLFWLEGISDEYLEKIYSASTCLIAASEGEGFGLPLIEAAQYNLPMIIRDLPVFKEIAGTHAFYFSGLHPTDISEAIAAWLELHKDSMHPDSSDMPWLTWEQSARQLQAALILSN